jgi:hypothetical protein
LFAGGALLLVWSISGEAHTSFEATQQGGNLLQITTELIHLLLKQPVLQAASMAVLWVCHVAWRTLKLRLNAIVITTD